MPVTTDIMQSYRRPRTVFRRLLDAGQREDRAIAILAGACLLFFAASAPVSQRQALEGQGDLSQLLTYSLFSWLFLWPLLLYGIAALSHLVMKLFRGRGSWYGARLALFWSMLISTPLVLLYSLTYALVGPGLQADLVGILWLIVFLLFWTVNLREAEQG
ncbi:MAG: YIP1 family protein [Pseudomonadota bacterium]